MISQTAQQKAKEQYFTAFNRRIIFIIIIIDCIKRIAEV